MGPVSVAVALGYSWYVGLLLNVRRKQTSMHMVHFHTQHNIIYMTLYISKSLNRNLCMCLFLSVREM